jgi:cellulose synthase/poly-beta-1,6-N-acetylglucosamine synthase-like glycosyltransferase
MYNLLIIILICSSLLILHTYVFYPLFMILIYRNSNHNQLLFYSDDELPSIAILIAAHNEEKVIEKKILSVFNTNYPSSKLKVFIGSDASTDRTDEIISNLTNTYSNIEFIKFKGRVGKISIINHLQSLCDEPVLILSDANVIFKQNTIFELVKYFKDSNVGLVSANIIKESSNNDGISYQEKKYLNFENKIKASESYAFNFIMGAEGGCYAIRNNLFSKVPSNFIVDDFFITMQVLERKNYALLNNLAICIEDVTSDISSEYRRKVRISSGNFQNLFFFKHLLFDFSSICFAFWSHKVLRWLTPFFIFICLFSSVFLIPYHKFFIWISCIQLLLLLFPLFNYFFKFNNVFLKFIAHFYLMNFALFEGFIKFIKGIKSSIWEPINRNV